MFDLNFITKYWKYCVVGALAAFVMSLVAFGELPDGKFHIWFLDVGQGDSILIQTPDAFNILVDGGPDSKILEELSSVLPFFAREIDLMVLTHPHSDHLNGLVEVLKRYDVHAVLMTGIYYNNSNYDEFLKEVRRLESEKGLRVYIAEADEDFKIGSVWLDVIYPFESLAGKKIANLNNSSIAMRVEYCGADGSGGTVAGCHHILLTGDLESEMESEILKRYCKGLIDCGLGSEIFKAPHHGSKTASSFDFVKAVSPVDIVIQVGAGNQFGHPHAETLRTYYQTGVAKVFRTDLDGRAKFEY